MKSAWANPVEMQQRLFAELSRMFGREVPLYDKSLLVNQRCNEAVCRLLQVRFPGFSITPEQLERTSGERHGAIRIGRPDEYRWVAGFFSAFGMLPHNFYDMTNLGGKSQPIIATAFRAPQQPEHRIFCSLLMTDYFDAATRARIEARLAQRTVFSPRAIELIRRHEVEGGLDWAAANELIAEGTERIFKWTGQAHDYRLYQDLSAAGFKIAADIACFESHHLNHLTPNTLWMDLYVAAMKFVLGELARAEFQQRCHWALVQIATATDRDYLRLHFKHLADEEIESWNIETLSAEVVARVGGELLQDLQRPDLALQDIKHSGFKDFTEGPAGEIPILLRQDSYKALTEPVRFKESDGQWIAASHTARFGEIEQRFYATTPKGRALYDQCLLAAESLKQQQSNLIQTDFQAYQMAYAECFSLFPKSLSELLKQELVYGLYSVTAKGRAAVRAGELVPTELHQLVNSGLVRVAGIRYEDFLPFSAAGIFASNLGQYGTKSTATDRPGYSSNQLEVIMERKIVDADVIYRGQQAESLLTVYRQLGIIAHVPPENIHSWESAMIAFRSLLPLTS